MYNPQIALDVFKEDPNFQQSEKEYEVSQAPSAKGLERHRCVAQLLLAPQDVHAMPAEPCPPTLLGCASELFVLQQDVRLCSDSVIGFLPAPTGDQEGDIR